MINTKFPITNQFLTLKNMFKDGVTNLEEFDYLSAKLLVDLTELTERGKKGDDKIEGVTLDLWKDRVWHLIERSGLLPEYKETEDEVEEYEEEEDEWYKDNSSEFDSDEKEPQNLKESSFDPFYGF
jgi:Ran GTPase-activating protein (RanGAP) involved in mRNA processing and transport